MLNEFKNAPFSIEPDQAFKMYLSITYSADVSFVDEDCLPNYFQELNGAQK